MTRLNTLALLTISHTQQTRALHLTVKTQSSCCGRSAGAPGTESSTTEQRRTLHTMSGRPAVTGSPSETTCWGSTPLWEPAHTLWARLGDMLPKQRSTVVGSPSLWPTQPSGQLMRTDIFLSKSTSWEDALLVYSSFWQWRTGVQGVLRTAGQHRRKVTIQKRNQLPHPCPRTMQEAARATHVPRAKNGKQQIRQTAGD